MSKRSKCTYKIRRFCEIENSFYTVDEKRVSIKNFIPFREEISIDVINFIHSISKKRDITQSRAIETIIKEFLIYDFTIKIININNTRIKIKNYKIHQAYIDIMRSLKTQYDLTNKTTFEQIVLNYKKNMNFL